MRKFISIFYLFLALFVQLVALHGTVHFFSDDCASKTATHQDTDTVDEHLVDCVLCDLYNHSQSLHFDVPQSNHILWFTEGNSVSFSNFSEAPIQTYEWVHSRGPPQGA